VHDISTTYVKHAQQLNCSSGAWKETGGSEKVMGAHVKPTGPRDEETINTAFVFYLFKLKTCEVSTFFFNFQVCCVGLANLASLTSSVNANRNSVPFRFCSVPFRSLLVPFFCPRCAAFLLRLIYISTRR